MACVDCGAPCKGQRCKFHEREFGRDHSQFTTEPVLDEDEGETCKICGRPIIGEPRAEHDGEPVHEYCRPASEVDHTDEDDAPVLMADGGRTVLACPECDGPHIDRHSPGSPGSNVDDGPGWRCNICGHQFDEPTRRDPHNRGGGHSRNDLSFRLLEADPDEVGGGSDRLVTDGGQTVDGEVEWTMTCLDCDWEDQLTQEGHPRDPPAEVEKRVTTHKHTTDESHIVRVKGQWADHDPTIDPSLLTDGGTPLLGQARCENGHLCSRSWNYCPECGDEVDADQDDDGVEQLLTDGGSPTHRVVCEDCGWSKESDDLEEASDAMERHARKEMHDLDLRRAVATDGGHPPGVGADAVHPDPDTRGDESHYCDICETPFATLDGLINHDCDRHRDDPGRELRTDGGVRRSYPVADAVRSLAGVGDQDPTCPNGNRDCPGPDSDAPGLPCAACFAEGGDPDGGD